MIYNKENEDKLSTVYWSTKSGETIAVKRAKQDVHIQPDVKELMRHGYKIEDVDRLIREWRPVSVGENK